MFHTVDLSSCPASFLMHRNNILAGFGASSYKYNSKKSKLLLLNHMGWFLPLSVSHRSSNIVAFKSDIDLWCLALLFKKLLIHNVYELYIYIYACMYEWYIPCWPCNWKNVKITQCYLEYENLPTFRLIGSNLDAYFSQFIEK